MEQTCLIFVRVNLVCKQTKHFDIYWFGVYQNNYSPHCGYIAVDVYLQLENNC